VYIKFIYKYIDIKYIYINNTQSTTLKKKKDKKHKKVDKKAQIIYKKYIG